MTRRRTEWLWLILILALAAGLRLYRLDAQSLWNDEGTSVALAGRSLAAITQGAAADIHPPSYYYLLHYWLMLAGDSEAGARSLSALAGVLLVGVVYSLGRQLFGRRTGLLAALLAALSPFGVYYAQEARMYIFVALWGALSMLAFVGLPERLARGGRGAWGAALLYWLGSVLAVYSHYFAFALLLAQNLAFLAWWAAGWQREGPRWRAVGRWAALEAAIAVSYVPWLLVSWASLNNWPAVSAPLTLGTLLDNVGRVFALGMAVDASAWARLAGALLLALAVAGMAWRPAQAAAEGEPTAERPARGGVLLAALYLLVPVALIYLLSLQRPMYKPKFLLLATPGYFLLQARGALALGAWTRRLVRGRAAAVLSVGVAAVALLGVAGAAGYGLRGLYTDARYFRDDYRGIAAYISAAATPGDAILINAPAQIETFDYYYHGDLPEYPLPQQRPIDTAQTEAELAAIVAGHSRIYAVYWATDESDPQGFIEGYLDGHCFKAMDSWFGNVRLVVYAVPRAVPAAMVAAVGAEFAPAQGDEPIIRLRGYTLLTPQAAGGEIMQLALYWEALQPIEARYKVFVHLVDERGRLVAQRDSEPGGGGLLTTTWPVGEPIADHYGLLLPAGTLPGPCTLRVGLYGVEDGARLAVAVDGTPVGDALDLAAVQVAAPDAPLPVEALDRQTVDTATWGGLELVGHSLYRQGYDGQADVPLRPGDVARLTLFWRRAETGDLPGERWVLALADRRGDAVWESAFEITDGAWPMSQWRTGDVARDIRELGLPAGLAPGTYRLALRPEGSAPQDGYSLGKVELAAP